MISAQASPVPVSPPCCLTTSSTPWSRAIGPSCLKRSTQSLRLPPFGVAERQHLRHAGRRRLQDALRQHLEAVLRLGVDAGEHHHRLQAQVAAAFGPAPSPVRRARRRRMTGTSLAPVLAGASCPRRRSGSRRP